MVIAAGLMPVISFLLFASLPLVEMFLAYTFGVGCVINYRDWHVATAREVNQLPRSVAPTISASVSPDLHC